MLNEKRKVAKLDTITRDMWGKTGIIIDVMEYEPSPPPVRERYPDDQSFNRAMDDYKWWENRRRKNHKTLYFLRFHVPNRCTGLWLTLEQMEEV